MKRIVFLALVLALLAAPAFAQFRLDLGVMVPRGVGLTMGGSTETSEGSYLSDWPFIPLPEGGIYYQGDLGILKLGIGARAFSAILLTVIWPNAYAELDFGRLAIEAQVGGLAFLMFGLASGSATGNVIVPDISAWYKIGKQGNFRLGLGIIGLDIPDTFGNAVPFLLYFGGKASLML